MPTLFTRIIRGELPGRFVWRDAQCVAFLTIAPLRPGHTLVVPIREVDHWLELAPAEAAHLTAVAQKIGRAIQSAFAPVKVGLMIAGLEVPDSGSVLFHGEDATDLAVHQDVASDLRRVAAGQGHVPGDNRNAVALAGLRERQLDSLGGRSLTELWNQHVSDFGIRLGQATAKAASAATSARIACSCAFNSARRAAS